MRALPYLLLIGAVVAALVWTVQRPGRRRALPQGPEVVEPAVLAFGPERGPGQLRVTPTQLVFASNAGRVLVVERLDITGVGATRDLPDRRTAAPVLVVSTDVQVYYFEVDEPGRWVRRLT